MSISHKQEMLVKCVVVERLQVMSVFTVGLLNNSTLVLVMNCICETCHADVFPSVV